MPLSLEERIETILLSGSGSCRRVAAEFDERHCGGTQITHDAVAKLIKKFKETESVEDKKDVVVREHQQTTKHLQMS